jgi:hypothetical protein
LYGAATADAALTALSACPNKPHSYQRQLAVASAVASNTSADQSNRQTHHDDLDADDTPPAPFKIRRKIRARASAAAAAALHQRDSPAQEAENVAIVAAATALAAASARSRDNEMSPSVSPANRSFPASSRRLSVTPSRKKRYRQAVPSTHCHICCRPSRSVPVSVCANIHDGLCRKVICSMCITEYKLGDWCSVSSEGSGWQCTHCVDGCASVPRAQCFVYQRTNLKRKLAGKIKKTTADSPHAAAPDQDPALHAAAASTTAAASPSAGSRPSDAPPASPHGAPSPAPTVPKPEPLTPVAPRAALAAALSVPSAMAPAVVPATKPAAASAATSAAAFAAEPSSKNAAQASAAPVAEPAAAVTPSVLATSSRAAWTETPVNVVTNAASRAWREQQPLDHAKVVVLSSAPVGKEASCGRAAPNSL